MNNAGSLGHMPSSTMHIRLLLAVLSLLLSAYALIADDIINSDGILYM